MTHTSTDQERAEFEAWYIAGARKAVPAFAEWSEIEIREGCMRPDSGSYRIDSARIAWDAWQAARRAPAAPQAVSVPPFTPLAQRKLDDLLAQGFRVTGYSIERADVADWAPQRGFITHGGMVGWWTPQAALQKALARLIAATELHHRNPLDLENLGRYNEAKRHAKKAMGMGDV